MYIYIYNYSELNTVDKIEENTVWYVLRRQTTKRQKKMDKLCLCVKERERKRRNDVYD